MTSVWRFYTGRKAVFLWALLAWEYEKRSDSSAYQRWVQIERAAWRRAARQERTKDACRLALWHPSEAVLFPARLQESLAPRHHEKRENLATCPSRPSAARGNFLRPYVSAGAPPRPPTGPLGGSRDAPASGGTPEPGGAGRGWTQLWMPASPRRQPVTPADAYKKEEDNLGLPRPPGRK